MPVRLSAAFPPPVVDPGYGDGPADVSGRWRLWSIGVLLVALAVRVAWVAAVPVSPISDSQAYDLLARNLAAGHGYVFEPGTPTAFWPVGTSAIYAALYKAFGVGHGPIVGFNLAMSLAGVGLTMALARDWFGPRAGVATGLLLAVWPGEVEFSTILASELPYNAFVLLALFAEGRDHWRPAGRATLTGLALTAACYLRPTAMLLPGVIAWCRLVGPGSGGRRPLAVVAETAAVAALMAALITPWAYRNYQAFGRPVLISTNGGAMLWMGNHPGSTGVYRDLPDWTEGYDEAERDEVLGRAARRHIRENPGLFVVMSASRLLVTHGRENIGVVWNEPGLIKTYGERVIFPLKVASTGYWWVALLLGLSGAWIAFRRLGLRRWLGLTPVALWGYYAAVHAVIIGGDKYHYPSVPFIASLGGLAVVVLLRRFRRG